MAGAVQSNDRAAFSAACKAAGITLEKLPKVVGEGYVSVLRACAVEDFLASELEDGDNIVDAYLKRRGWKESVPNKRYLRSLRSSVMSLYEVSDIVRDQSFLARDLLRGGEALRISERSATRTLKQWDRLAARIVNVGPKFELAGGGLAFSHELGEDVRAGFEELKKAAPAGMRESLGDAADDPFALGTEILRQGAFLFTHAWLGDALQRTLNPQLPGMVNSDGDEIAFTTVRYRPRQAPPARRRAPRPFRLRATQGRKYWRAPGRRPAFRCPIFLRRLQEPESLPSFRLDSRSHEQPEIGGTMTRHPNHFSAQRFPLPAYVAVVRPRRRKTWWVKTPYPRHRSLVIPSCTRSGAESFAVSSKGCSPSPDWRIACGNFGNFPRLRGRRGHE